MLFVQFYQICELKKGIVIGIIKGGMNIRREVGRRLAVGKHQLLHLCQWILSTRTQRDRGLLDRSMYLGRIDALDRIGMILGQKAWKLGS